MVAMRCGDVPSEYSMERWRRTNIPIELRQALLGVKEQNLDDAPTRDCTCRDGSWTLPSEDAFPSDVNVNGGWLSPALDRAGRQEISWTHGVIR